MKTKIKSAFILFSTLIAMNSCQSKNETVLEIDTYLSEDLQVNNIEIPHLYLFLPVDSCGGLLQELPPYFNSLNEGNYTIVLIGRSKKHLDFLSEGFKKREFITYDTQGFAFRNELVRTSTPRIYKVLSDDEVGIIEYPGFNPESIKKEINGFLNIGG